MSSVATQMHSWEALSQCLLCDSERIEPADAEYSLSRCLACGYVFDNPRPTLESIVNFYSTRGKYDSWINKEAAYDRLWRRRLRRLLRVGARGRILDVGAGTGQFLKTARFRFESVDGTEVSESAVRIAKEKYHLDVRQGALEQCNLPRSSFDTITLFHVLEHVPDPQSTIALCRDLLKPDGILLICVPNDVLAWTSKIKLLGKRLGLPAFQKFSPRFGVPRVFTSREIHLSHFTPKVLRASLERAGVGVIDESLDPYYSADGIRLILHTLYYTFHRFLFAALRVNRYDTIWMVAKKSIC